MAQQVPTVYLHIGAFRTGTTYLQQVLRLSHEALAEQGVLFPGNQRWRDQVAGVRDLLGMSTRGGDDVDRPSLDAPWSNVSLGAAESEALRRLNESLGEKAGRRNYQRVVKRVVARRLSDTTPSSGRMSLPPEDQLWATKTAREMADVLAERRYHVVGDLEDLVSDPTRPQSGRAPDDVDDRDVVGASTRAAAALTERLAQGKALLGPEALEPEIGLRHRLASRARGASYRFRRRVAGASRHNRVAARGLTAYRRAVLRQRGGRR